MRKEDAELISRIVKMYSNKDQDRFSEHLKDLYRWSIRNGGRSDFVNQVKRDNEVLRTMNYESVFSDAGDSMFSLSSVLAEYTIFQKWLGKMIGCPL